MEGKKKNCEKGKTTRGGMESHSTLAVDSSWPFFFSGFSKIQGWPLS
jgi:hypothetical protein